MTKENSAQKLFELGLEARWLKKKLEYYDRALEIEPKNIEILKNKGECLSSNDQYEEAIRVYSKALEIEPKNIEILKNKEYCLSHENQYEEAIKVCDTMLKIEPKNIEILITKGMRFFNNHQYEDALKVYDKALEIEPNNIEILARKGLLLFDNHQYEDALKVCDKWLGIFGDELVIDQTTFDTLQYIISTINEYSEHFEYPEKALKVGIVNRLSSCSVLPIKEYECPISF